MMSVTDLLRRLLLSLTGLCCIGLSTGLGDAIQATSGIGIYDTLFISENVSFSVRGDVYMKKAHVLGKGTLVLQGNSPGRIVSLHSEVNHLEVNNRSKVSLSGELHIRQSLTVRSGTFDVSAGHLDIPDSARILLLDGAKIIRQGSMITRLPAQETRHTAGFSLKAILSSVLLPALLSCRTGAVQFREFQACILPVAQEVASVPPEV